MTIGTQVGGNYEDSNYSYSHRLHRLRLCVPEQEKKEEITGKGGIERCRPNLWR